MESTPFDGGEGAIRANDPSQQMFIVARETRAVAAARRWLGEFLSSARVDDDLCRDAVLVLSELVTNSLRHGLGPAVVRASINDAVVRLSVTDSGEGLPSIQPPDQNRIGGVGLRIVDEISREWGVARFPGGTTVWAIVEGDARGE